MVANADHLRCSRCGRSQRCTCTIPPVKPSPCSSRYSTAPLKPTSGARGSINDAKRSSWRARRCACRGCHAPTLSQRLTVLRSTPSSRAICLIPSPRSLRATISLTKSAPNIRSSAVPLGRRKNYRFLFACHCSLLLRAEGGSFK